MSIKTERLANLLVKEISSILMTEIKDEDLAIYLMQKFIVQF